MKIHPRLILRLINVELERAFREIDALEAERIAVLKTLENLETAIAREPDAMKAQAATEALEALKARMAKATLKAAAKQLDFLTTACAVIILACILDSLPAQPNTDLN